MGIISWIAPSGGYVDFLEANHIYPSGSQNPSEINKDPEPEHNGLPVADLISIFQMKLNSPREKDLFDLIALAKKLGIPKKTQTKEIKYGTKE